MCHHAFVGAVHPPLQCDGQPYQPRHRPALFHKISVIPLEPLQRRQQHHEEHLRVVMLLAVSERSPFCEWPEPVDVLADGIYLLGGGRTPVV